MQSILGVQGSFPRVERYETTSCNNKTRNYIITKFTINEHEIFRPPRHRLRGINNLTNFLSPSFSFLFFFKSLLKSTKISPFLPSFFPPSNFNSSIEYRGRFRPGQIPESSIRNSKVWKTSADSKTTYGLHPPRAEPRTHKLSDGSRVCLRAMRTGHQYAPTLFREGGWW